MGVLFMAALRRTAFSVTGSGGDARRWTRAGIGDISAKSNGRRQRETRLFAGDAMYKRDALAVTTQRMLMLSGFVLVVVAACAGYEVHVSLRETGTAARFSSIKTLMPTLMGLA